VVVGLYSLTKNFEAADWALAKVYPLWPVFSETHWLLTAVVVLLCGQHPPRKEDSLRRTTWTEAGRTGYQLEEGSKSTKVARGRRMRRWRERR
jgi:hypothetical protein